MTRKERYYEDGREVVYDGEKVIEEIPNSKGGVNKIYRHGDAEAIEKCFEDFQVIILEAGMGDGKSSVLRSFVSHFSPNEILFFNGQNFGSQNDSVDKLKELLAKASPNTKVLVIDSADYLFQKKKFIRTGASTYLQRSFEAIDLIDSFKKDHPELKILLTSHDENWRFSRKEDALYEKFSAVFKDAKILNPSQEVPATTSVRYLEHQEGLSRDEAWYVAELWKNPVAQNHINNRGYLKNNRGTLNGTTLLRTPRIISQIFKKFPSLKSELKLCFSNKEAAEAHLQVWILKFVDCALATDYQGVFLPIITETRAKQRAKMWGVIEPIEDTNDHTGSRSEDL